MENSLETRLMRLQESYLILTKPYFEHIKKIYETYPIRYMVDNKLPLEIKELNKVVDPRISYCLDEIERIRLSLIKQSGISRLILGEVKEH